MSGSHGGQRRFSDCVWTTEMAFGSIMEKNPGLDRDETSGILEELIGIMSDQTQRHMLRYSKDGVFWHITRVAEIVRTTGNLHEYKDREAGPGTPKKYSIIDGTAWQPRLRYGARRRLRRPRSFTGLGTTSDPATASHPPEAGTTWGAPSPTSSSFWRPLTPGLQAR